MALRKAKPAQPATPDVSQINPAPSGTGDPANRQPNGQFGPGAQMTAAGYAKGGRPKGFVGLAKYIRERMEGENGNMLADWSISVFMGTLIPSEAQVKAHNWLTERGYGKALQSIELQTVVAREDGQSLVQASYENLSDEELIWLKRIRTKLESPTAPAAQARLTGATATAVGIKIVEGVIEKEEEGSDEGEK